MKTNLQTTKWQIFREMEKLPLNSKKRSALLTKFNNMIEEHTTHSVYDEATSNEDMCENCGHDEFKKIREKDEYYQYCKNCMTEL